MRLALAAILASLAALPAAAYVRTRNGQSGRCLYWVPHGHSFVIDAQGTPDVPGTAAFDAIRRSFLAWGGPACSDLTFADLGLSSDPAARRIGYFRGQSNANIVLFRTASCQLTAPADDPCRSTFPPSCANKYDCWDGPSEVIATTTTTSVAATGEILDSDIELNDAPRADGSPGFRFTAGDGPVCTGPLQTGCVDVDVQNTVTHEAGHTLGLAHTPVVDATMFASAPRGQTSKRVLHADDIQAICAIYPAGQPSQGCDPASATALTEAPAGGCGCSHGQAGPGGALAALAMWIGLRRRGTTRAA